MNDLYKLNNTLMQLLTEVLQGYLTSDLKDLPRESSAIIREARELLKQNGFKVKVPKDTSKETIVNEMSSMVVPFPSKQD